MARISRRTKEKMAAAKARGRHMGRPFKLCEQRVYKAHKLVTENGRDLAAVAEIYRVAPITLRRAFRRIGLEAT